MKLIDPLSQQAVVPELDLFAVPGTQLSVVAEDLESHYPIHQVVQGTPIQWDFDMPANKYVIPRLCDVKITVRINPRKDNGNLLTDAEWNQVKLVNNSFNSLFENVSLLINDVDVVKDFSTYPYKTFFDVLLGFAETAKKGYLKSIGWNSDYSNKALTPSADKKECKIDFIGKLMIPIMMQERAFIGGINIKLKLSPNNPKFFLITPLGVTATMDIIDPEFRVQTFTVSDELLRSHQQALNISPAKYFFSRAVVIPYYCNKGHLEVPILNLARGRLPRRMFVALLDSKNSNGDYQSDPYEFKHFDLNYAQCQIAGRPYPIEPYQPDFGSGKILNEYISLYKILGQYSTDTYCEITPEEYKNKFPIIAFNFSPDLSPGTSGSQSLDLVKDGELKLTLRFKNPLKDTVTALIYLETDHQARIDGLGNVSTDYF